MKNFAQIFVFCITLMVQSQYMEEGILKVNFVLNDQQYAGVCYDDMYDMLNEACEEDANK